ncbi:DUF7551 domain-containing protein [Halobellus rubicundus]|uniref:Uncharacterized protein n=1 Tax=Halobellus rubicundus TaxID=2996466 RepID=A0ABD5MJV3_9EURY
MVGPTLVEIRSHIESLASETGEYCIRCGRTGDRPVPAAGKRFDDRETARKAVRATEQYRTALRRYDPRVPYYDLIVCQVAEPSRPADEHQAATTEARRTLSEPVLDVGTAEPERRELVEFCHRIAGAVFETLSDAGYDDVEASILDEYFELAESVGDPDELCLCLLESMAVEIETRLGAAEQAEVLGGATTRLGATDATDEPIAATLAHLSDRGLIGEYSCSAPVDSDGASRSIVVRLTDYALSPRGDRLPILPIVIELFRRQADPAPTSFSATECRSGWRITLTPADAGEPAALSSAPIESEE